jgi:lysophospholipase L1-like esterase
VGHDTARELTDHGRMIEAGSTYVALGSSFAAGPGIEPVLADGPKRSGRNYAHQVADALNLRLVDVTSSGATTADILSQQQRTSAGRLPRQIEAVSADTGLVTVTVGGNDIGYIGKLIKGSLVNVVLDGLRVLPTGLRRLAGYGAKPEQYDAAADALVAVVDAVRARAPMARVVLVDYLTVLGDDARTGPDLPLRPADVRRVQATADGLAAAFARAAQRSGADLVTASAASAAHGVGSAEPWVTGFAWRPMFAGKLVPYHPTPAGMSAVAALVVAALSKTD